MKKKNQLKIKRKNIEFFLEKQPSKLASVTLFLPGGTFYEPFNQKNISHLAEHLITLTPHAGKNYADWRHNYYQKYKLKVEAYTYKDHVAITVSSPSSTFKIALNYLFNNWLNQDISNKDFQRAKNTVISEELQYCDYPVNQSIDKFNKVYGGDRKLFIDSFEKLKSSDKATVDQVRNYLAWTYNSDQTKVSVCGNIDFHLMKDYIKNINIPQVNSDFKPNRFKYQDIKKDKELSSITVVENGLLNLNYIVMGFYSIEDYDPQIKLLFMLLHSAFREFVNLYFLSTGLSYTFKTGLEVMPCNSWLKTYLQVNPVQVELMLGNIIKELNKFKNEIGIYKMSKEKLIEFFVKPSVTYRTNALCEMMYYNYQPLSLSDTLTRIDFITYSHYKQFIDRIIRRINLKILFYGKIKGNEVDLSRAIKLLD